MPENENWTAQTGTAFVEPDPEPGQRFGEHQLPEGENASIVPENLIATKDDPQGPEPWEDGKTEVLLDGPVDNSPGPGADPTPQQAPDEVLVQGTVFVRGEKVEPEAEEDAPAPKAKHKKSADPE